METTPLTILVVDDEPDTRTFIATVLQDAGYATRTAADGNEALQQVGAQRPALITLDITMPGKSGVGFYRQMKESEATRDIPIVMVTGMAPSFETFISSRRQVPPPEGYLPKPVNPEELVQLVLRLLPPA